MIDIESEVKEFIETLKNTRSCCFITPTKFVRYDTGRAGDLKYEELLVCDFHFKLKPFYSHVVQIFDLIPLYQAQPPEVQKELFKMQGECPLCHTIFEVKEESG